MTRDAEAGGLVTEPHRFFGGEPVGEQSMFARDFAVTRSVSTSSWLGLPFQGRGIGTELRAAVLHLAFAGLDAVEAASTAFADNAASRAGPAKLGYVPHGQQRRSADGVPRIDQWLALYAGVRDRGAVTRQRPPVGPTPGGTVL
ncbi:GNAT family N-acetyltransferase [Streptacidiphilus sp. P02-A3a]|uniref:GNAT family N-acetyltransferase n=1 Tax=Streptacidiphilus sp. P02-A3a TaxID=2704468 RepID=UPI001CDD3D53|nr:GNAT family protein [Streptacidiphilus sp. P02-A3a]